MSSRLVATRILQRVIEEKITLTAILDNDEDFLKSGSDKALIQEIIYGSLRWYLPLKKRLALLLDKPVRKKDRVLEYLLITGLYQLRYMRIPSHAVVSESVSQCKKLKKDSAKGLVNAVLRRYLREQENIEKQFDKAVDEQLSHPDWLVERLRNDWPENYAKVLTANNLKPPMYLRVNTKMAKRDDYQQKLEKEGMNAVPTPYSGSGIQLTAPCPVDALPGFTNGEVSVQELAAQLAAPLLDPQPGERVLDACAAPGGKSLHILEYCPGIDELVMVEKDERRAERIKQNLERAGLSGKLKTEDLLHVDKWWDGMLFDRILLDAPCSATGVIRRHPDIKLSRTPEQVSLVNTLQQQMMDTVWDLLKPGGTLLYATCSVLKQENSDTIRQFIANRQDCKLIPIEQPWGLDTGYGRQILTGMDNMDGFFYCLLTKSGEDK